MAHVHGCKSKGRPTPEYLTWVGLIQRCENPKNHLYPRYGGRGIGICERWRTSFVNFLADVGPRLPNTVSLERIDPAGHFEPGNCRWVSTIERRTMAASVRLITYGGKTQTLTEWSAETGISTQALWARLSRPEWSIEQALTVPMRARRKKAECRR